MIYDVSVLIVSKKIVDESEPVISTGIRSSCHDTLLDSDVFETCVPGFEDYLSLLARIAQEADF